MTGVLFVVSTPIGNLEDLSKRAARVFSEVDFVAAEDTRVTIKLLNSLGIKKTLISYYEHNKKQCGERILTRLLSGENGALATDAGTPAISDPGSELVALCADSGVSIIPVPGSCALVCALAVSGINSQRFCFEGFLSTSKKSRFEHLDSLKNERRTMVFYEAPHKLLATLEDMLEVFGDRRVSISRELTKLHEETIRTTLSDAVSYFNKNPPRGEFALVISGAVEDKSTMCREAAMELLSAYRAKGHSLKSAARLAALQSGIAKNELYALALEDECEGS